MLSEKRTACAGLLLLASFFFLTLVADNSEADTIDVDIFGGSDYTNITQAVENATSGDTIRVAARTYHDTVLVNKQLTILGANEGGPGTDAGNIFGPSCDSGNLVARYKFDETSGSNAGDEIWCDNLDGDVEGASWTSGVWENGLDFDGTNDYVKIAHDSVFNITSTISVSAWIYNEGDGDGDDQLIAARWNLADQDNGASWQLFLNHHDTEGDLRPYFHVFDAGTCQSDDGVSSDEWILITATYDGSSIKLYENDELVKTCSSSGSIPTSSEPLMIGAHDYTSSDNDYFDGKIDDVAIWNTALSDSNIAGLHWSGDGSHYPIVNASNGGYSFKITADNTVLKKFEVQYSGDDQSADNNGDAGVFVDNADDVQLDKISSKYNSYGIRLSHAHRAKIYTVTISCEDSHIDGLKNYQSDDIEVAWGNYDCATHAGIYSMYSKGGVYRDLDLDSNHRGIFFFATTSEPNSMSSNYINDTNIYNSGNAAIYFDGADNNTVYGGNIHDQWNGISFKWGANDNTVREVDFQDSSNYDIYHGGCDINGNCGGWNNILIDNDFDDFDLYIDSASRLLEKELVETTVTGNGTYPWNRVNTTLDADRRAFSGANSFWAGSAEEDEYFDNWNASFKLNTDISLPSGGDEENRILEIKTWYKTEATFDGGRVYISKDSGTTWSLLTPIDGYDGNLQDVCNFDGGAFHGDKSELGWQTKKFNLSAYRGEDVRIKFNFCSDNSNVWEGWYVDDVKIYRASDSRAVSYFDDFERMGHRWILSGDWVPEGSRDFVGRQNVDAILIDGGSSELLFNQTLNPNLVNFWKFDESSGNTYDSVTGKYASLYGGATYATGRFGNGLSLDGTNDYARNSNAMYSSGRYTEVTISAWVKFDSFPTSGNYESLVNPRYDGDVFIQVDSDGKPIFGGYFYGSPSGEQRATGSTTMVTGVWYHITGTWSEDTDKLKVYLNGTLDGTNSFSGTSAYLRSGYAYNYFGRDYNGRYMDGILDNVIIWSTDLSVADIQSLHNSPLGGDGRLYATSHFGGSDSKTNSDGKLADLYVVTKIYAGSSTATSVDTYTGLRYSTWSQISTSAISENKLKAKIPDSRVYNRNDKNEYIYISDAVDASSSSDVIELWPGKYKENVVINKKLTLLGSGASRTIIDARYLGSAIKLQSSSDYSVIENISVIRSKNTSSTCSATNQYAGIDAYQSYNLKINNVRFIDNYAGFVGCYTYYLELSNSYVDSTPRISKSWGIMIYNSHYNELKNNEITEHTDGIWAENTYYSKFSDNFIHNNTSDGMEYRYAHSSEFTNNTFYSNSANGIYFWRVSTTSATQGAKFTGNSFVDNNYGFYGYGSSSSNYNRYMDFNDNKFKSNSIYGLYCYYYCYNVEVENNTFIGDSDTIYGLYLQRSYYGIIGNNTFHDDHTSIDIYMYYCGSGTLHNKFFNNNFTTITVTSSCDVYVYDYLNLRTVEEDADPFSGVELELKDDSQTYYQTPHWSGSDSVTDTDGYISSDIFLKSASYSGSSTLTVNTITANYAYGIRAQTTTFNFTGDTTKSITIPDYFRKGVVNNTDTGVLYTSISSAISSASTGDVLRVWSWTFNEQVIITKGITLVGNSTSGSIINGMDDADPTDYTIEVKSDDVTISNLTLGQASDSVIYAGNFENLVISHISILSTGANNGIHFEGTESVTVSDVTINNTDRRSVLIEDGDTITFKDSNFKNSSASHGFVIDQSEQITLDNVFIHNPGYSSSSSHGISVSDSDQITIQNSTKVAYSKSYVINIDTVSSLIVRNSTFIGDDLARIDESNGFLIENSSFKGSSEGNYSIYIKDTDSGTFQYNTITNPSSDGSTDTGAIFLSSSSSNSIKNNTVTNSGRSGIHLKSASADNLISGNTVTASYYFGLYISSSDGNTVRENTFKTSTNSGIKISSSDGIEIDTNTLDSNTEYGLYVSASDNIIVKFNSITDNNAGIYVTTSDDAIFLSNTISNHPSSGASFQESKRLRFKLNTIKDCDGDALSLSSDSNNAFVDNNTIKNNGDGTSGRAVKLSEVSSVTLYNNSIESNTYSGMVLISSSSNKIVQNTIDDNGQYGIQITNDAEISHNNTIKDNLIKDNSDDGISSHGMFTKIINNTIKFNDQKGIVLEDTAARSTILDCILDDNEGNAIHIFANHVLINGTIVDGDTSDIAISVSNSDFVRIMNTTVEGGSHGIKFQNSTNAFVYKNTVNSNAAYGIYFMQNSTSAQVKNNTVTDNGEQSVYIHTSSSAVINGNTLKENTGYGLIATNSKFIQISDNTIEENGGGIKFSDCDYCNVTSTSIKDNIARGVWLLSDSDNNSFTHVNSSDNNKDVYFQSSKDNKGFNFSFSTVTIDSSSTLTLTYNLDLVFQSSNGSGFSGMHFELISGGVQFHATPFYGGIGLVSDSDGEVGDSFSLDSKIYNGSSTPDLVSNVLKYHYGVRSKEKSIDMSTSHTETVSVPSNWTKGLVRNADTGMDYHKIQYAIDNASAGHTLNVWAWTYNEVILIDESISLIGNSSATTNIIAGTDDYDSDNPYVVKITADSVVVKNLNFTATTSDFDILYSSNNDSISLLNNIFYYSSAFSSSTTTVELRYGDNHIISGNIIYPGEGSLRLYEVSNCLVNNNLLDNIWHGSSSGGGGSFEVTSSDNNIFENNTLDDSVYGLLLWGGSDHNIIRNNTVISQSSNCYTCTNYAAIRIESSHNNTIIANNLTLSEKGIRIGGSASRDNTIIDNSISDNNFGIHFYANADYNKVEGNVIKDSTSYGVRIDNSTDIYFWNNTIVSSGTNDIYLKDEAINNYVINTTFSTVSVDSSSSLFIKEYLVLQTKDASGDYISGIDIRVSENTTVRYETSYFGGTDSKTDVNGTIPTFLLDTRKYQGSSTPLVIPTYVSARHHDWVETSTYDAHDTIQIAVPDLRVKNNRTGEMTYNLETAINNATSGDLILAWAGIYYEYLEIGNPLTIRGNGTSTIVDGTFTEGYEEREGIFEITSNDVTISDLLVSGSNDVIEEGISVIGSDDVTIRNVKFINNTISIYVEDSQNLYIGNSVFDVDDSGIYFTGSSSNAVVRDNVFRNGSDSGDNCIFQSSSDETGDTQIINNTFDDCDAGWKSGSSNNIFRENTLNDNNYGVILNGIEAYGNLVEGNTIKDSNYGIRIYNSAHDNNLFSNTIQDSANSDIKLGESEDTISFNNTFSTISVNSNANMWVKVYLDLTVYDNSSNAFSNADIEVKEDNSVLYSTGYFGGSDDRTDANGTIETFLVAISHYNGSSVPDDVTTNISVRFVDWIISGTYNVSNSLSFSVPDFRVQNQDNGNMFYSIGGAISASSTSNGHVIQAWTGTYREQIVINKQITLVGNGTSKTFVNGSGHPDMGFASSLISVTSENVDIMNLSVVSSAGNGINIGADDCDIENLFVAYNSNAGINTGSSFLKIVGSTFKDNIQRGIELQGASEVSIINNTFIDDARGINLYNSNDVTIRNNTISSNGIGIISTSSDDVEIYRNLLHNNTNEGIVLDGGSSGAKIHNNTIEHNSIYGIRIDGAESSLISDNMVKSNSQGFKIIASDDITFLSNTFLSNDGGLSEILPWGGDSGSNLLENNTFDDTELSIEGSNQTLIGNVITNSPGYGIKLTSEDCDNNKFYHNTISNSNEEDIFVGGSGNQINNIGYNNTFSTIEVESNGEFIILDYVNVKTVNATGDKSGIDIRSYYNSSSYYSSAYFGGTDPLTISDGTIPSFLAPVEHYDGSSTPDLVSLPVRARFVDWVETFYLDTSQGDSITIDIPDLRVKNMETDEMTYHIQTTVDNAGYEDRIYVMDGIYLENVIINQKITLATCEPESYGNCYSNGSVLIDAQQNGSAIKISEDGAEIKGFTVTNASSWPEAGIRVNSDSVSIFGCVVYQSPIGILFQETSLSGTQSSTVSGAEIGIWFTASSNNSLETTSVYDTTITDISLDSYGYADSAGSKDNTLIRMMASKINFTNSPNNRIIWPENEDHYQFDKVTLVNSHNIESVGYDDPEDIEIDSDSSYFVKNQVNIHVTQNGTYLSDVDVKIWNDTEIFYATSGYGGTNTKTVAGTMLSSVEFAFKEYIGSSSGSENSLNIEITHIDFVQEATLSGSDGYPGFCYQCTIYADFEVPLFRVYNDNSGNGYYYLQSAIDSATSGDKLLVYSSAYYENIEVDKSLTIEGQGMVAPIIIGDINNTGFGSPPLDGDGIGLEINADNVDVSNIRISNFSKGMKISSANAYVHNVDIFDILGQAILIDSSSSGSIVSGSQFINYGSNNNEYGIKLSNVNSVEIFDNMFTGPKGINIEGSNNKVSNNSFIDIDIDALYVHNGNNNIFDSNKFEDVDMAFYFAGSNANNNLIINNSHFVNTRLDLYVASMGSDNRFINNVFSNVDNFGNQEFELSNVINLEMRTVEGPANNVHLEILEGATPIYATSYYSGSSAKTDIDGRIEPITIAYETYNASGSSALDSYINYYYDGVEYNSTLDTSTTHTETIWVNLRPVAFIDQVSGIGDNPSTSTEEAVKGADILMVDNHTVAYWPFGEGSGQTVTDVTEAAYTGMIRPAAIWNNEGRPNATDSSSVEFDGTFTNIETTAVFELTEFTAEVWFKTDSTRKMVLFSDKDNSQKWGYNMYVDNGLAFDFTVNNGGQVFRLTPQETVTDNQWHFATVVRDSSSVQLWLDGELVADFPWSGDIDFTQSPIYIGQNPLGSESFEGLIDDLRFSDIPRHNEDFMTGGGIVIFESYSSYDTDGQISEYIWSSAIDGELGRGQTLYFAVDDLTQGSHNIQLQVMDDNGTFSVIPDSMVLLVKERPDSAIFSVAVNGENVWSGWSNIEANSDDTVSFEGGTTSGQSISEYSWISDIDGLISSNAQFDTTTLSNGTHTITFTLKGANGLWSSEQAFDIDVNGRPDFGNSDATEDTIYRLGSAMFKVRIEDDNTDGSALGYNVAHRVKNGSLAPDEGWESAYITDIVYNSETEELEFTFTPDESASLGEYEFLVEATDEEGGVSDHHVVSQSITVQNNEPEISNSNLETEDGEPLRFSAGSPIELGIDSTDEDGTVSTVIWYADNDGDGVLEEIGTGANFSFEDNNLPIGENNIKVRVLDNDGGYVEQGFTVIVTEAEIETTFVDNFVEDFSSNLPLIALLAFGMVMVVGTVLLRRNRSAEAVPEGLRVDDGVSEQPGESFDTLEWEIPTDAQGNALIIGEYMAKRRESYLTYPNNDEVLDYLHNNRERFQISSYFDVPAEPPVVLSDWALPDNLRGNVHLDSHRKQIVERITNSTSDKNFVIIGEPGVGKTVMMFEVFDRLMYQAPVGILSTDTIAKAHEMFGVRVFYDDIPENAKLVEALTDNEIQGVIVTSREADWKALPTEMQAKFDRLTVPLFNEMDMKEMIKKMMTFQSIGFNEKAIDLLAEYSEGSPIYVWSMVREMMHRSVKSLSEEYIKENSIKGMINYVAQLLQRLLKDGEEYRPGGLHALASLIFLSDHMEERYCNDYFFDAYVEVLSKHTEEKLDDKMNPKTLNLVLAYLPINDSVIRFPHDTWPDVLQGWGDMNPFSSELRMINRAFADSGLFQSLKKEVVKEVWDSTYERYKRTPSRQKTSLLALADTLFQNFTIDELKKLDVDIDIVRQVASTYSHIPQAAKLISKIQAVLPQTVTRIINVQDISSEEGHAPYKIQEMYLIYNDGRMITSLMDEEAKVDSDIMSSMLTAINDFVKDSFQTSGNLGSIDYGENQIILERGKHTILASVVYGEADRNLRSRMGRALTRIEDDFSSLLKAWDGDVGSLEDSKKHLEPVMDLSKSVTKSMIDELQALKDVGLRSSWSQVAGFVQVNLVINNYSKKQLKGAKLSLEYGTDYLKLVKTEPSLKYTVTEVALKQVKANDEMSVTLYFEPLKSTQASLNVHMDYEAKAGQSSGVSTAVFERVDLYKEGASLDLADLDDAGKAEIVPGEAPVEAVESTVEEVETVEATVEEVEIADEPIEEIEMGAEAVDIEEPEEIDEAPEEEVVEEEPAEPAPDPGESGVDDLLSKLSELDDPESAPKKKDKKSDEEEDTSGMDDVLGKLDEL